MNNNQSVQLVKIRIETPDQEDINTLNKEVLWAEPLGEQLYRLDNVPFYAFSLNVHDVVRCEQLEGDIPVFAELIKPSGYGTLRVIFCDETSEEDCIDIIHALHQQGIYDEKFYFKCYGFVVEPNQDYEAVCKYLRVKEDEGYLWLYENE
ncbi:MAG TPA: DUF4265 domain-containing protein [Allocoleopsis sp.]